MTSFSYLGYLMSSAVRMLNGALVLKQSGPNLLLSLRLVSTALMKALPSRSTVFACRVVSLQHTYKLI